MANQKKKPLKKSKGKVSFVTKLMILINSIFIFLLLASYLSLYVSPVQFWPFAFAGFAYLLILICNLLFVIFWLVFFKKYFLLSLFTILLGFNQISTYIKFTGSDNKLSFENGFKMMSYNVRLFDLYNWRNEAGKNTRSSIFELIHSESPDILCLQEYYSGAGKNADFADTISCRIGYKYRKVELISKKGQGLPYGLATFSKYPIIHNQKLSYPNSKVNFCLVSDMIINKDTVRVMNLHLESIKFGAEDYNFVNEITSSPTATERTKRGFLAILGKMKRAYIQRTPQIETVVEFIRNSPYPVLLAGDFNDTPVSYCYRQVDKVLDDSFVDEGKGLGQTHTQMLPLLRIDYIFHSQSLQTIEHRTINKDYSDHYPVIARFRMPE